MEHPKDNESTPAAHDAADEEVISQALELLHDLDNTPLSEMSPLFYQHGFEQLDMTIRDLLRLLGPDADA